MAWPFVASHGFKAALPALAVLVVEQDVPEVPSRTFIRGWAQQEVHFWLGHRGTNPEKPFQKHISEWRACPSAFRLRWSELQGRSEYSDSRLYKMAGRDKMSLNSTAGHLVVLFCFPDSPTRN